MARDVTDGEIEMDEARAFLARAEVGFRKGDLEEIIALFAEDVRVLFADFPPMVGRRAYRDFLESRLRRQLNYTPTTTVRVVNGNVIGSSWEATWTDAVTGSPMRGRGCEFVTIGGGLVVDFVASFNAWDDGGPPRTPITMAPAE